MNLKRIFSSRKIKNAPQSIPDWPSFDYEVANPCMYQTPSFELDYQAYKVMAMGNPSKVHGTVTNCQLVLNLPGPIYIFAVNFKSYFGPSYSPPPSIFAITGCLTFFRVDIPYEHDLETDAKDRILLYFGHLLLYCFCKRKYKPPFGLRRGLDSTKFDDSFETKKFFFETIQAAIQPLGYPTVGDLMPILKDFDFENRGDKFLDGRYYQRAVENPIDIGYFINFHDRPASETTPRLFSLKRTPSN